MANELSIMNFRLVYVDSLPGADPRTRKLPLFVFKHQTCEPTDPKIYHFKFAEITLNQFEPSNTSASFELNCSNHPLCINRILVKNILTADFKSEEFATFKNWKIVHSAFRISSLKPHNCNGLIHPTIPLVSQEGSIISVESAFPPRHKKRSYLPPISFSIKINDEKFQYISGSNPFIVTKGELFSPMVIYCVKKDCESSIEIFPTQTVDPNDEDLYTRENWRILKILEKSHQCYLGKRRQRSPQVWVQSRFGI